MDSLLGTALAPQRHRPSVSHAVARPHRRITRPWQMISVSAVLLVPRHHARVRWGLPALLLAAMLIVLVTMLWGQLWGQLWGPTIVRSWWLTAMMMVVMQWGCLRKFWRGAPPVPSDDSVEPTSLARRDSLAGPDLESDPFPLSEPPAPVPTTTRCLYVYRTNRIAQCAGCDVLNVGWEVRLSPARVGAKGWYRMLHLARSCTHAYSVPLLGSLNYFRWELVIQRGEDSATVTSDARSQLSPLLP